MTDEALRWLVLYAALGFSALALSLGLRTYWRIGRPRWPLHGRWIVTLLVASWAGRITDLALARQFGWNPNLPHTVAWWALMDVMLTWTAYRLATGRLIIVDRTRRGKEDKEV